ncbi:MAG: type II secretion system F family protein [Planctomycetota bacterium]|nr:type II secretion system F family protein [Planctomycetota bacterium]
MSTLSTSQFFFRAMTPAGATKMGLRAASNEATLADDLRREQLVLLKAWRLPLKPSATPRLPLADEAALNEQLATLLSRGVPLVDALEVAATVVKPASRARVMNLRDLVAAGASFSDACRTSGTFDEVTLSVYRAAERTGDVAGSARRLAASARRRLSIRGKAVTVLIYPAVVCSIAAVIFFCLLVFLVPMIADQLRQMRTTPNAYSQAVFSLGVWMRANLGLTLLIIVGAVVAVVLARKRLGAALMRALRSVPAVASLLLTVEMTRFFSVMAAMVKSGVPLADALATSAGVISAPRLREQLLALQRGLVEGGLWRTLVEKVTDLPLATRRLLIAAERAGDLDSAFDGLSQDMADEVDVRSARLLSLLEPLAIVMMFMLIGPLILAIAIPMLTFRSGAG